MKESQRKVCFYCTSQTKYVSKEHGVSFHLSPFPSRFQSSRQFSSSPFSYRKLFGSPAFQFVNVIGRPFAIQKKLPSSAKSVPDVQKCSLPRPESAIKKSCKRKINGWQVIGKSRSGSLTIAKSHRNHECASLIYRSLPVMRCWPSAYRGTDSTGPL